VLLFVVLKQVEGSKATVTISKVAFERFLSVVDSQVSKQIAFFSESFFASFFRTNERSLASMKSHVDLQATGSGVSFVAAVNLADERFLTGMCKLMGLQVSLSYKLLIALNANEWSLSRMSPHVRLEVTCLGKLFEALFERTYQYLFLVFWPLDFLKLLYITNNES